MFISQETLKTFTVYDSCKFSKTMTLQWKFGFWLMLATFSVHRVVAYPSGAPEGACSSMVPNHGYQPQMTSSFHYAIKLSSDTYCPNNEINVTLVGSPYGGKFKGFLCQARTNINTFETSGTLKSIDTVVITTNKCSGAASLTHMDRTDKMAVHMAWKPDSAKTDSVTIVCTVVQEKSKYWVKESSVEIRYAGQDRCTQAGDTKGLPTSCTDSNTCESAVSMAVCNRAADADGECVCPSDMKIAHPSHTFCSPKMLGDQCTSETDCMAVAETVCDTTKTCACKPAFTYNTTDNCHLKVLGDECSSNDDCRGIPKSVCDNMMCKCPPEYMQQSNQTHINCVLRGTTDVCKMDTDCPGPDNNKCVDGKCTTNGATKSALISVSMIFASVFLFWSLTF